MAKKISVMVAGAKLQTGLEYDTLKELQEDMDLNGYTANVNGKAVELDGDMTLSDGDYIIMARAVKGRSWDDEEESEEAPSKYPKSVFTAPTLVIVQVASDKFKVNGLKVSADQLEELYDALDDVLDL